MMSKKISVTLLHNIMAPYRYPLFRSIADDPNIDLTVDFMSVSAKNRMWKTGHVKTGFKYKVLPNIQFNIFGRDLFTYIINYTFPFEFIRTKCDVLISAGWLDFSSQIGFLLCKILKRKFIIWSESTANEPSWRRKVSLPLVRMIVRGSDACIAIGSRSRDYLISLGVNPEKVFVAYSTVDVRLFKTKSKLSKRNRLYLKNEIGIKTDKLILYVGQFIERKGLLYLLRAFNKLSVKREDVSLLLLGYGPLKVQMERLVSKVNIKNVFFKNHVEISEMPKMYGISDVFVLPSYEETWGLVVNEAMASGLPIVTTRKVGSSEDLIQPGINGFVVKERSASELYGALDKILRNPLLLRKMSEKSKKIISKFTPEEASKSFIKAIRYTTGSFSKYS